MQEFLYSDDDKLCPFCADGIANVFSSKYDFNNNPQYRSYKSPGFENVSVNLCYSCGWWNFLYHYFWRDDTTYGDSWETITKAKAILKSFDIKEKDIPVSILIAELKKIRIKFIKYIREKWRIWFSKFLWGILIVRFCIAVDQKMGE